MSITTTTSPIGIPSMSFGAGSSALPAPLSPDQFSNPGQPPVTLPQIDTTLTPSNVETLRGALQVLKAARADAGSTDPKVAAAAKRRLASLVSYLAGFADSRGWLMAGPVSPGLESIFGAYARPTVDDALDELQSSLESTLAGIDTRSPLTKAIGSTLSALGDVAIAVGAGLIVAGVAV